MTCSINQSTGDHCNKLVLGPSVSPTTPRHDSHCTSEYVPQVQVGPSLEKELNRPVSADVPQQSNGNGESFLKVLATHDEKLKVVDNKVDNIELKLDNLGEQMNRLLQHLSVGLDANGKMAPDSTFKQADVREIKGLREGVVESEVIFTLAALGEIRSTMQTLVEGATGVVVGPEMVHLGLERSQARMKAAYIPDTPPMGSINSKGSYMDGTMTDSDSSDFDSQRVVQPRRHADRRRHGNAALRQTHIVRTVRFGTFWE